MSETIQGQKRPYGQVRELSMRLRQLALTYAADARLPGQADLCRLLGTSTATLNEVLERLEAQKVIYRQRGRGIFVSPHLFRTGIAIIFNADWLSRSGTTPFWGNLLGSFVEHTQQRKEERAEDYFFYLLIGKDENRLELPEECMQMIQDQRIRGVLSVTAAGQAFDWLHQHGIPNVGFAGPGTYMVDFDNTAMVRLGVARLVEQGCRRIALWGTDEASWAPQEAFTASLHDHGLPVDLQLVSTLPPQWWETNTPQKMGYMLVEQEYLALEAQKRPDGILCTLDQITEGVLSGLHQHRIVLGDDLFLVTHGNQGSMLPFEFLPGLTVIDYDPAEVVTAMFNILDRLLAGDVPDTQRYKIIPHYRGRTTS